MTSFRRSSFFFLTLPISPLIASACGNETNSLPAVGDAQAPASDASPDVIATPDSGVTGDSGSFADSATSDSGSHDSATNEASAVGCMPDASATCVAQVACGPVVQTNEVLSSAPMAVGGPSPLGLYFLTKATLYHSAPNGPLPTFQYTRRFSQSQFTALSWANGVEETPASGTFSASGTTMTFSITCPTTVQRALPYSSDATTLTLYETQASDVYEFVYTKQ